MERRDFLKTTVGAGLALAGGNLLTSACTGRSRYDAKGLQTVMFGKTGVRIPRISLGLGSRFCHMVNEQEANELLHFALDNGLYYWDTAHIYDNTIALPPNRPRPTRLVISEERVGEVTKTRRKEIFLATKVSAREPSEAMRQIETSLKRMNTDTVDMLKIHAIDRMDDLNQMSQKGQLIDIVLRMKEEKVTRFIGFSSHSAVVGVELSNRAPFDCMLMAMNHYAPRDDSRTEITIATAKEKNMGFLLMKAVRPRETVAELQATELIKYALSLDGPHSLALGMDSIDVVKSNLDILRNFQKLPPQRMQELTAQLAPFYNSENLPWMQKGYCDGKWKS